MTLQHRVIEIRLSEIEVSANTTWRHVQLMTDSGLTGVGEATLFEGGANFSSRLTEAGQWILDRPLATVALDEFLPQLSDLQGRTILSAFDQALTDLGAQIAGQPISAFLGATTRESEVALYANINRATRPRSPSAFAHNAKTAAAEGYRAIKIAPFDGLSPSSCDTDEGRTLIEAGLARIESVREAVPTCELMVDCHWRLTPAAAAAILPPLHELGVIWLECPLPETRDAIPELRKLRTVASRQNIRLCGLETAGGWSQSEPFVEGGAYDLIMPDVKHAGGLKTILDIGHRAKAAGVAVSLHNPSGPIAHLFSVHVMVALGGEERMEVQWNESPLFGQITSPPPILEDGMCRPTSTPGLGAVLDTTSSVSPGEEEEIL